MKQKITISISVLLLLISLHKITTSGAIGRADINTQSVSDSFKIGATDNAWQGNNDTLVSRLKHNVWHKYGGYPNGWKYQGAPGDSLYADSINYYQQVKSIIDNNASNSIMTAMDRGKISLLAWSQRSDYQCEDTLSDNDYWFYGYNTHSNINMQDVTDSIDGKAERVRYCYPHPSGPEAAQGWIVKDLTANREQINRDWWYELNDSVSAWFIKPRIRIDSDYANDPGNFNKEVCKIFVLKFNGDTIKQSILRVRNFLDQFGNYNGIYLEEFRFEGTDTNLIIQNGALFNPDKKSLGDMSCQVDFRIWYYGNCEMWIDRVRVENEVADELLSGVYDNTWLRWECNLAMENPDNIWNFYIEEFEFNNTPSIAYVNKKIKEYTNDRFSLMVNLNYELYKVHLPYPWTHYFSAEKLNKYLFEPTELETWWNVGYVLEGWTRADSVSIGGIPNYHPNTLSNSDYNASAGILSYKTTPAAYDDWLQVHFDQGPASVLYINQMKLADTLSKDYDKKVINLLQAHMWHQASHKLKEPSNEELEMINMLPLTYGIKGIIYFTYSSVGNIGDNFFYRGLIEPGLNPVTPRYYNVYGQEKWTKIKYIATKLNKWGPYLVSFDNDNRKSYIYRITSERNEMSENTFIDKLKSFPALEFAPDPVPDLSNEIPESSAESYLQAAFFQKENPGTDKSKYFMIVNRRCSPFINYNSANNIGGRRLVTMKINPTYMPSFNNWKIINLENEQTVTIINKNDTNYTFIGDFMPGEGKLYKIAPVMQEGGILVADEDCGGEFDCKAEVNNNGYDINIRPGTTINFTDSLARIIMTEGDFKSGITPSENTAPVFLKGKNGHLWKGLVFQNCPGVEMWRTYFENIAPYELDSTYAADIINCGFVSINYCSFRSEPDINAGGVRANFTTEDGLDIEAYILNNYFEMDAGGIPALSVTTSGYITFPVIIEGNSFESYTGNSFNAILLSGIEGGAIKENTITGYKNGIILIWSSMDIYGNIINGGVEDSKGILSYASSNANLAPDGSSYTGGFNMIACEGENAKCIDIDNSFLLLNNGFNIFDLKNYEPGNAYHLSGAITDEAYSDPLDATLNCFQVSETDTDAVHNMTWTNEEPVNYNFLEYYCGDNEQEGMIAFYLGNEMYDTIYTESSGSGGGVSNDQLPASQGESIINDQLEKNVEIVSVESLEDSVAINLRRRDYERVSELCHELLDDYMIVSIVQVILQNCIWRNYDLTLQVSEFPI